MPNMTKSKVNLDERTENLREIMAVKSHNSNSQNQLDVKSLQLQNTGSTIKKKEYGKQSGVNNRNAIHSSLLGDYITVKARRPATGSFLRSDNVKHRFASRELSTKTPFKLTQRSKPCNRYHFRNSIRKNTKKRQLVPDKETQTKNDQRQFIAKKRDNDAAFTPIKRGNMREKRSNKPIDDDHGDGNSDDYGDVDTDKTNLFLLLLAIIVVGQFVSSPSRNLADTATLFSLQNNKADYGKIRLWGNVGQSFIIPSVSLLVYFLKTSVCGTKKDNYKMAMYILAGCSGIAFLLGFKIIFPPTILTDHIREAETSKKQGSVGELVVPLANWSFLIIVFFLGTFEGVFNTFMFWLIVDLNEGQSALIVAVATFLRNATAFVTFAASSSVFQKFGAINAINISLVLYSASFLVYSVITNPWIAIIPEVIQYVSFSLSMAASVTYMGERAPENLAATAQGIVQFMYSGFGQGVGPIVAGLIIQMIGTHYTFLAFAVISLLVLGFSVSVQLILWKRETKLYQKVSTDEDIK
ncbi:major facilitator superfamily domain-containing protein 6-B-like isoform X2 [Actinia tenebrosa]|nr:major facilitator superfamily domain-containing protein 6-B-like isoform X2 [Actinia tenebrosa]